MAAWWLTVVCAVAVLHSAEAQEPYASLPDVYKKGVDLALEQLNSHAGVHHHFRFLRTLDQSSIESGYGVRYLYLHFYLKPTHCTKGTALSNPQACPFRNDRPLMDCAVCYKTLSDQMESIPKPYVHCIQKPRLTAAMANTRMEHCRKMSYNSGGATLLAVSMG
uniref:Retinoic acid receptor responder protein 2 n=1 Tax=Gouania willdenowi TaxID=441366 RepID=A0A8C5I646_GOUWI